MSVQPITQVQLDQWLPRRWAIGKFIGAEVEWFSDPAGHIVGLLAERADAQRWGYAILRRDQSGLYRFWDLQTRIAQRDLARHRLEQVMAAALPPGRDSAPLLG